MPPKPKYTKEEIIDAAVDVVREKGESALTARELGNKLGTTSRPIFTAFKNMDELKQAVLFRSNEIMLQYRKKAFKNRAIPRYKAIGVSYIEFAAKEKNLFKLRFMRDRTNESYNFENEYDSETLSTVMEQTGLNEEKSNLFHTEMWIYTHGIATMIATSYIEWTPEQISSLLTDAYLSFSKRHLSNENLFTNHKEEKQCSELNI